VRWFGLTRIERRLGLTRVMWSCSSRDWKLDAAQVEARLRRGARPGAIFLLHDGRERAVRPDISSTVDALARLLPEWLDQGYRFQTVSELCLQRPGGAAVTEPVPLRSASTSN
jgi:peptidoglycan/xylan/chitin deacetylase (PgdA/CDA1 family)